MSHYSFKNACGEGGRLTKKTVRLNDDEEKQSSGEIKLYKTRF